jgi:uncharacterized membrane protein
MRKIPAKYRQWLLHELSTLEDEGILSAAEHSRLASYYSAQVKARTHWATIAFAILGALLIGGGIILLFAHNWENLSRNTRAVLSFCPLAASIPLSILAIRRGGTSLCESAGIFQSLAIGACIALIGQTYHLPSNTPGFLLAWALLIMPLIFLLPSTGAYLFYLALICSWSGVAQQEYGQALGFWLLVIPAVIQVVKCNQHRAQDGLLSLWGLMLMLPIALGIVLERTVPGLWVVAYASFLSLSGLLGLRLAANKSGWRNPLLTIGLTGITVLTYLFTWQNIWHDIGWSCTRYYDGFKEWGIWVDSAITTGLGIAWALTAFNALRSASLPTIILCSFPLFAIAGFLCTAYCDCALIIALLFNVYMLALGLAYLVQGCRDSRLRQVNYGMAILSLLLITRFFDSDFGFLARGLAFIIMGICFLSTNLVMARKKHQPEDLQQ